MGTLFDIDPKILDMLNRLHKEGKSSSESLRQIFSATSPMSPPDTAEYYRVAFGVERMEALRYLGNWWHSDMDDILTDEEFDAGMAELINNAIQAKS